MQERSKGKCSFLFPSLALANSSHPLRAAPEGMNKMILFKAASAPEHKVTRHLQDQVIVDIFILCLFCSVSD